MLPNVEPGSPEWAYFKDWVEFKLGKYSDWTIIADLRRYSVVKDESLTEQIAILSYLARNIKKAITKVFEYDGWDTQYNQGDVQIEEIDNGIVCHEDLGDDASRVFITYKGELDEYPAVWKLWPTFENYFKLRYNNAGNLIDPYNGNLVVEIPFPADKGPVRVRTDYLQDYLATRNMVLIRQHDHIRYWTEFIPGIAELEADNVVHKEKWGCYRLDIINSKNNKSYRFSRLVAKDIVTPYEKAGTVGGVRHKKATVEDYPEFVTSKGLDGKEIKMKPNPKDILYPTFFDPKILKRYYDEPSKYTVGFHAPGFGGISFLNQWSIPMGRNKEGLIVVWLGDLAKAQLSYEEITHWRVYNVAPRGGVAIDFWNAQMECRFPEQPSLEKRLIDCRHVINEEIKKRQKSIYKQYEGPDKYLEKTLRIPLFDEHTEFKDAVLILSKIFIEYLDIENFCKDLPNEDKNDKEGKKLGPITIFSNWLKQINGVSEQTAQNIRSSLQNIQLVRAKTGVAHRFSDDAYREVMETLHLSAHITAKPLYNALTEKGLKIWLDEFELKLGDSLLQKIDEGLANSRYGIVILSHNFFAKDWPRNELDGLIALEIGGKKRILPVWHKILHKEIVKYSPILAGRYAARSDEEMHVIVKKILNAVSS